MSLFPAVCLLCYFGERRDEKSRKQRNEEWYEKVVSVAITSASEEQIRMLLISKNRYDDLNRVLKMKEKYNEDKREGTDENTD